MNDMFSLALDFTMIVVVAVAADSVIGALFSYLF